jgi:endo-1,4-beta-xylanase
MPANKGHEISYSHTLLLLTFLALGCSSGGTKNEAAGTGGSDGTGGSVTGGASFDLTEVPSLYQKYVDYFPIGAAVDSKSYTTHAELLVPHFNSITAENEMKFNALQSSENKFNFSGADKIVDFATTNQMKIRGHALVWHSQTPSWLFIDSSGADASPAVLLARMKSHISTVMNHFKGKVYAWDVVNEAIMDTGAYRTGNEEKDTERSSWYKILGESYIAEAFKAAREADPDAKLYYNDFHDYVPAKHEGVYNMLKSLIEAGVPIDGVGIQGHLNIDPSPDPNNQGYYESVANLEEAINQYSSLGLDVQITEMDLSMYVTGVTYTSDMFLTADTFTDELKTKQAERYREYFELFRKHKDVIKAVTLWGIADDNTWLSEFTSGRKDFPLLFDDNHQPKMSLYAVANF